MKGEKEASGCRYQSPNRALKYNEDDDEDSLCCSLSQLKFSLYLFNVLFFLSGVILVGVGLWTFLEKHPSLIFLTSGLYDVTACVLIFAGIFVLIAAVAGFCGLSRDSHVVMLLYSFLLGAIFLAEVAFGAISYLYKDSVTSQLGRNLETFFMEQYGVLNTSTKAVDHLQLGFTCCGVHSFQDWRSSAWWEHRGVNLVPDSCCITPQDGCGVRDHPSNIRYSGCMDRVAAITSGHLIVVGAVALGICLLQLVGTILSCSLAVRLRKAYG